MVYHLLRDYERKRLGQTCDQCPCITVTKGNLNIFAFVNYIFCPVSQNASQTVTVEALMEGV